MRPNHEDDEGVIHEGTQGRDDIEQGAAHAAELVAFERDLGLEAYAQVVVEDAATDLVVGGIAQAAGGGGKLPSSQQQLVARITRPNVRGDSFPSVHDSRAGWNQFAQRATPEARQWLFEVEMPTAMFNSSVAYFSMEICLEQAIPTYSGGLGVLAGDTLRSAADLEIPMVGVTLLHRKGYFQQQIDAEGNQIERPVEWRPEEILEQLDVVVSVKLEGRDVRVRPWKYVVKGVGGHEVPVLLLDTALPENSTWDQTLTDSLYGGDNYYRLGQEAILGLGGAAVLQALGYDVDTLFHLNE
jgi:hypothetical protein